MRATIAFLFATLFFAFSAVAAPVTLEDREVPVSKCSTVLRGVLKTAHGETLSLKNNKLVYGGKGLEVKFQSCQPNFGQFDGKKGRPLGGHVYVPSIKKCLSIPSPGKTPYEVSVDKCEYSDDSIQTFFNFVKDHNAFYWVGGTQADHSYTHGSCKSGHYGPLTNGSKGNKVQLKCDKSAGVGGFKISH
jgi:hypothetical protein